MRTTTRRIHALLLALVAVALAVGLTGCSSGDGAGGANGGDSSTAGDSLDASSSEAQRDGVPVEAAAPDADLAYGGDGAEFTAEPADDPLAAERAVIRKGNVSLRADDVGKAQFDVQKVVDEYDGRVTAEETTTDDDGEPAYTRLVLRIPSDSFDEAMTELKGVTGTELDTANTHEDDVTTKLIDTRTRIEAQRRSIARITVLFDRAESIRDIMAIESQLSQRQADLDSLERQAAYLAGQASLSTITVSIDQIPEKKAAPKPKDDDAGFVAGFKAGWDALAAFAVGLATALGALLPWIVAGAIVAPPAWLLARAIRRRFSSSRTARTPSAA